MLAWASGRVAGGRFQLQAARTSLLLAPLRCNNHPPMARGGFLPACVAKRCRCRTARSRPSEASYTACPMHPSVLRALLSGGYAQALALHGSIMHARWRGGSCLKARSQRCPVDTPTAATMAFTCVAMHHQYIQHGCHAALLLQLGLHQPQELLSPHRQRCRSACCTSSLPLMHQGGCTEGPETDEAGSCHYRYGAKAGGHLI